MIPSSGYLLIASRSKFAIVLLAFESYLSVASPDLIAQSSIDVLVVTKLV